MRVVSLEGLRSGTPILGGRGVGFLGDAPPPRWRVQTQSMMLCAWPQVAAAGELRLWLGVFGTETPPAPAFSVNGRAALPKAPPVWSAIRDRESGPGGRPLNHQAVVRLDALGPDRPHRITIAAGGQQVQRLLHTPPAQIPAALDGSFNLLLASCYFQPGDGGGLLGTVVEQLPLRPHMTLLAGDQVYLDLPLFEDLPETEPALSRALGDKYRRNWTSSALGIAGLEPVLARAPTLCIPDDHEFWNNFPFRQVQLPGTWTKEKRERWKTAAQSLYEDYQQGGAPGSAPAAWRVDVEPLAMLMLDTRCRRRDDMGAADGLMAPAAVDALATWEADLLAARATAAPRIGLLASGQALFVDRPGDGDAKLKDAELANYAQFDLVERTLERLADAGVPVVFVTGDVHWGRVCEALHLPSGRRLLHEVICSPSRLIETPFADQKAQLANALRGLFGRRQTWPRHAEPLPPPARFGSARRFAPTQVFGRRGDQVALLQFTRAGRGLELRVSYHAVHPDPAVARPETTGPFTLLPF